MIFLSRLRKPKLCLPLKKLKNVSLMSARVCLTGGGTLGSHLPACLPKKKKTPQHIFQLAFKVDIQSARQEEKKQKKNKQQCGLCLGLKFSEGHYNHLLPSQTFTPPLRRLLTPPSQKREAFLLCLHSQLRATHWISFSLSGLSFFMVFLCLFWFCLASRGSHGPVCSLRAWVDKDKNEC